MRLGGGLADDEPPSTVSSTGSPPFADLLDEGGEPIGSDFELCATLANQPLRLYCTITARAPGGRLIAVGGTGAYAHAHGTLTSPPAGHRSERFTFRFRT